MNEYAPPAPDDAFAAVLLQPVAGASPCGPSLDHDPDHVLLMARLQPRSDAQYGAFVDRPAARDWAGIGRDCESLLRRTRDIALLVGWCRARLALARASGLVHALASLHAVATRWPDDVHPQRRLDGTDEPAVRANAIAGLVDPEGLLGEIGDLALLVGSPARRLTLREAARALTMPRATDSADPASVRRYLQEMQAAGADAEAAAQFRALHQAAIHASAIDAWSRAHLGADAPSLERLLRLLAPFSTTAVPVPTAPAPVPVPSRSPLSMNPPKPAHPAHPPHSALPASLVSPAPRARHDAAACIRAAREWFEVHEPSSPVAVLLKQAERMVGQRFVHVADAIPLDLLRRWDAHQDASPA